MSNNSKNLFFFCLIDLLVGFVLASILFWVPSLAAGNGGLLGMEYFPDFLSGTVAGLFVSGILYSFIVSIILSFVYYLFLKIIDKGLFTFNIAWLRFILFFVGVYLAFAVVAKVILLAFNNAEFGL